MKQFEIPVDYRFVLLFGLALRTNNLRTPKPRPKMDQLRARKGKKPTTNALLGVRGFQGVGNISRVSKKGGYVCKPDFCITTADLVEPGAGDAGKIDINFGRDGGWFFYAKKYPMWPP